MNFLLWMPHERTSTRLWVLFPSFSKNLAGSDLLPFFSSGLQHLERLISIASSDGQSSSAKEAVFPSVVTLAAVSEKYYALSAFSALVS
jgi:hypothetical protein